MTVKESSLWASLAAGGNRAARGVAATSKASPGGNQTRSVQYRATTDGGFCNVAPSCGADVPDRQSMGHQCPAAHDHGRRYPCNTSAWRVIGMLVRSRCAVCRRAIRLPGDGSLPPTVCSRPTCRLRRRWRRWGIRERAHKWKVGHAELSSLVRENHARVAPT